MGLIAQLLLHGLASLGAGLLLYQKFHRFNLVLIALAAGWVIDLDHLIDYWLAYGSGFDWSKFATGRYFLLSDKIYVLFHGWEYVMLGLLLTVIWQKIGRQQLAITFLTVTLSLGAHLTTDSLTNELPPSSYSVLVRLRRDFELRELVYPDHWQQHQQQKKQLQLSDN